MEKNDPRSIWVSAHKTAYEDGSYSNPFGSISKAVESAQPGQTVVLKAGKYFGDVTIQKSGSIDKPVRIVAEEKEAVECIASCWFFYDVSDIICSGIVFKESPGMALSVIGKCMRNRFEFLRFINCSIGKENTCTVYFGGSGQACNTVESCYFNRTVNDLPAEISRRSTSVGLMISEGDFQEGEPNCDYIISKNVFSRYGYGVIVGSQDSTIGEYGHRIVYNTIDNCAFEGIMVKCGDTLVKGNVVRNCDRHSISVAAGTGSILEDNRVIDCGYGIRVAGKGHSINNNCIVRCREDSLAVVEAQSPEMVSASNIIIEQNTFIGWGNCAPKKSYGVRIDPNTTCVVRRNLFHGKGKPYFVESAGKKEAHKAKHRFPSGDKSHLIADNIVSGGCDSTDGCMHADVAFQSAAFDNYINESGYGARGWMLSPEAYDPGPETFYESAAMDAKGYEEGESVECSEADDQLVDVTVRSLFFNRGNKTSRRFSLDPENPSKGSNE